MFINIITPCSRPKNLHAIAKSINIPQEQYRWIIVHDATELPDQTLLPDNALHICSKIEGSVAGHGQRNVALNFIEDNLDSWIYQNDDDTVIHPELFDNIAKNQEADFIHFQQVDTLGNLRLESKEVKLCHIDNHNFIFKAKLLENTEFIISDYCADGYFAEEIYKKAKNPVYINKVLSVYNSLR